MAKETQDKPQQQDAEPAAEAAAAEAQAEGAEPQAGAAQAEGAADLPENEVTIEDAGTLKKKVTVE